MLAIMWSIKVWIINIKIGLLIYKSWTSTIKIKGNLSPITNENEVRNHSQKNGLTNDLYLNQNIYCLSLGF